jgi:nucleoside-triphosphatase THEP1
MRGHWPPTVWSAGLLVKDPAMTTSSRDKPHVLLIAGAPGVGKTTVIRRVADRLKELKEERLGGFYTEEIRENARRCGFRLVGFDGETRIIAHAGFAKKHRVGKYGVVQALDEAALLLRPNPSARGSRVMAEVKRRPECELWQVTPSNREALPARILARLAGRS